MYQLDPDNAGTSSGSCLGLSCHSEEQEKAVLAWGTFAATVLKHPWQQNQ